MIYIIFFEAIRNNIAYIQEVSMVDLKILNKYNTQAPRYTSYPTLPNWTGIKDSNSLWKSLKSFNEIEGGIDLYIHIPYCQELCWYCGCNRVISRNQNKVDSYLEDIWSEFLLYLERIPELKISSIHFGGGTPNFIKAEVWDKFLDKFKPYKTQDFLGSVELDPRTLEENQVEVLSRHGFKRASFGIQDFDDEVQKAINRIQPYELVSKKVKLLKKYGFSSVNFDLIYGLPRQSLKTISETIKKVKSLEPDLIAFYSYAHLPKRLKNQRLIKEDELLFGIEKLGLYESGKKELFEAGYKEIGMDHFALYGSFLEKAEKEKKLYRSFMGYSDKKKSALLGLGVSAISMTPFVYTQNDKDLMDYREKVASLDFPYINGHELSQEDSTIASVIQDIMCNKRISALKLSKLENNKTILQSISELIEDGLIEWEDTEFIVTKEGTPYLRNIAMSFDTYSLDGTTYSSTL